MKLPKSVIETVAYNADLTEDEIRWEYSGRAMYGKACVGFVADRPSVQLAMQLAIAFADEGVDVQELISNARTDNMGLGSIVYFQNLEVDEE